ncbi:hypothetical protein ACS0TY_014120 [Phlomoides rotata]
MLPTSSFSTTGGLSTLCDCSEDARPWTSWTQENPGRRFYGCRFWRRGGGSGCQYFKWLDPPIDLRAKTVILTLLKEK